MAGMEDYFGPRRRKDVFEDPSFVNTVNGAENRDNFPVGWDRVDGSLYNPPQNINYNRRDLHFPNRPTSLPNYDADDEDVMTYRPNFTTRPDRDITVRPVKSKNSEDDNEEALVRKYIATGVGLATLITENLLSHPFVVLRRQCQVHNNSYRYHLVPVTLLPVMWRLNQRQGITTLWKGLGSILLVRGMTLAIEDAISKFTPWPKDFKWHYSTRIHCQHFMLKCLTFAIVTPFYSASLVETVQSDIASEKPGIFDVFREGICRLVSWGSPQKGRMLPVLNLVVPTVVFGIVKYIFGLIVQNVSSRMLQLSYKINQTKRGALPKDYLNQAASQEIEMQANLISLVASETIFYPLETILHRLHLQGTRTIIDNLDTGTQVTPILTNYEGAMDCYETTLRQEGVPGLYKGFGALILQFAAHVLVVKVTKMVLMTIAHTFCGSSGPCEPDPRFKQPQLPSPLAGVGEMPQKAATTPVIEYRPQIIYGGNQRYNESDA